MSRATARRYAGAVRFEAGQIVGRYRVEGLVGRGGMGEVYRACAVEDGAVVAIKALRDDAADDEHAATRDEDAHRAEREALEARFAREGRLASRFRHPRFCGVLEVGEGPRGPYLVMEWIDGRTLRSAIADTTSGTAQRLEWLLVLADALADAHRAGIVHRDFKPGNVMITASGAPKILDFGLAKRTKGASDTQPLGPPSFRTATGAVLGTARYMSPEQLAGAELAGPASDQFAWGITAYEVLSGLHPALALERGSEPFPVGAPRRLDAIVPGLPSGVAAIVARTLAMFESDRYGSMDDVARELRAAMTAGAAPPPTIPGAPRADVSPSDPTLVDDKRSSTAERPVTRTASMAPRKRGAKKRKGRVGLFWISVGATLALAATGAAIVAVSVPRLAAPRPSPTPAAPEIASVSAAPPPPAPGPSETAQAPPPPPRHAAPSPPRPPHAPALTAATSVVVATPTATGSSGPPPPRRAGPRVLVVRGVNAFGSGYDSLVVEGVLERARPEMEQCYRAPTYDGRNDAQVGLIAYVEESGVTSKIDLASSAGVEPNLSACLVSAGKKMRFPSYPRSRPASVRAYLSFE